MVLASSQTVTGAKVFLDGTMVLRNVANTINSAFTHASTLIRTWTLPDANTVVPIISQLLTIS